MSSSPPGGTQPGNGSNVPGEKSRGAVDAGTPPGASSDADKKGKDGRPSGVPQPSRPPGTLPSAAAEGTGVLRRLVLTLAFTDLVGSTALKRKLGDAAGGNLIRRHQRLVSELAMQRDGEIVVSAGDGFLVRFPTPSKGVSFALALQAAHEEKPDLPKVRIGIHMGEVSERRLIVDGRPVIQLEGYAVDLAARFQGLAMPGQILTSYVVFENAKQTLSSGLTANPADTGVSGKYRAVAFEPGGPPPGPVSWRSHGRFLFKGLERAVAVFEVGIEGKSPLVVPQDQEKGRRVGDSNGRDNLESMDTTWRPSRGQEIPKRPNWSLEEKLGGGGGGDAWLISHRGTGEKRVMKFCYDRDQLRALQREVTMFRLMRETLGERRDIVRILDWQFEEEPFYIEMEYAGGLSLTKWAEDHGGLTDIPMSTRVEIVAQVADAVAAAHSVGILHKDIKPANVLVSGDREHPQITMIDFGIGSVTNRDLLVQKGITAMGVTEQGLKQDVYSPSGTRLYMAPELLEGKAPTILTDVYSLGVLLYQVVSGALDRALAPGWERDIPDELLRKDIAACVDRDAKHRMPSTADLAVRLRSLEARRTRIAEEAKNEQLAREAEKVAARARHRIKYMVGSGIAVILLLVLAINIAVYERRQAKELADANYYEQLAKRLAERQTARAEGALGEAVRLQQVAEREQYFSNVGIADVYLREGRVEKTRELLLEKAPAAIRGYEWGHLLASTDPEIMTLARFAPPAGALHACYSPDGKRIATGDKDGYVALWDAATGRKLAQAKPHERGAWVIQWSPDGRSLAVAGFDKKATVLDAQTLTTRCTFKGHTDVVRSVSWSPDGTRIASGSMDNTLKIWDSSSGETVLDFPNPSGVVYDVAWSPDGSHIARASLDGTAVLLDAATGQRVGDFAGQQGMVLSIAFSADGRRVVTAGADRYARIYDAAGGNPLLEILDDQDKLHNAKFSPDGTLLATGNESGTLRLFDISGKNPNLLRSVAAETQMYKVDFSPSGARLLTTSGNTFKIWDVAQLLGRELRNRDSSQGARAKALETTAPLETARVICYPQERGRDWKNLDVQFNMAGGDSVFHGNGRNYAINSFFSAFSPNGKQRIDVDEKTLRAAAYDNVTSTLITPLGNWSAYATTFSPDGHFAAVGGYNNTVHVYSTESWKLLVAMQSPSSRRDLAVSALRFSPDSHHLAAGFFDGTLELWRSEGWTSTALIAAHQRPILDVAFSPDGKLIATGSTDKTGRVFDVESGDQLTTLTGHTGYVHTLQFHKDGNRLITAAADDTVKLWEVSTGREIVTLFNFNKNGDTALLTAGFQHDGMGAFAVTSDRKVITAAALPWKEADYPGNGSNGLLHRIELYNRRRANPAVTAEDISW